LKRDVQLGIRGMEKIPRNELKRGRRKGRKTPAHLPIGITSDDVPRKKKGEMRSA